MSDPRFASDLFGTRSIFGGYQPAAHGGFSFPGLGMPGQMAGMFMTPFMAQAGASAGMMPGQFQPIQNYYDQHLARQAALTQQTAMAAHNESEREHMRMMMRNMAGLTTSGPLTASQGRMIDDVAAGASRWLPMLTAVNPGLVDSLFGTRGSGSAFAMGAADASRMMAGAGGMTGMNPAQAAAFSSQVHQQIYGPGANLGDMRGIGGAQAGQMMAEMSRRGLMGTDGQMPGRELDPASVGLFHSGRAAARVKEMAGAVSAMRDIFGDIGRGDAPMQELIAGLERLTQGGMATMDKGKMENLVRRTHQMAKIAGVGIDAVAAMAGASADRLDAAGIDRSIALDITSSSMAFATAYGQVGGGGSPAWRKAGKEKLMAMDQRLREGAAGSAAAHQMGVLMMLGEQGALSGGPGKALYEAALRGDFSGMNYMEPDKFSAMLQGSGVSAGMANQALLNTKASQEYVQRYRLQDVARDRQMETDVAPVLRQLAQQSAGAVLEGRGLGRELSGAAGSTIVNALTRMSEKTRGNANDRTDSLVMALEAGLGPAGVASLGKNAAERKAALREMAIAGWSNIEQGAQTMDSLAGYEGAQNIFALMDPKAASQRRIVMAQAEARAGMAKAMSRLGTPGPMQRLMDELGTGKADASSLALRFFGSVSRADGIGALQEMFAGSSDKYKRLKVLGSEAERIAADTSMDPGSREKMLAAIRAESGKLEVELSTLTEGTDAGGAERMAKDMGVSLTELLQGKNFKGEKLDEAKVKEARAKAGMAATGKALGITAEAGDRAKAAALEELRSKAAPDRKAALAEVASMREKLIKAGRASGAFRDKADDADITDEELSKIKDDDFTGDMTNLRATLKDKGIGLDEYKKAVEADAKSAKDREMTLRGELRLAGFDIASIAATGVPGPG